MSATKNKLENVKIALDGKRAELHERRESMWNSEGTSDVAKVIQAQLEGLNKLHASMKGANSDLVAMEAKIFALFDTLTILGVDATGSNITAAEVDLLEDWRLTWEGGHIQKLKKQQIGV